MLKTRFRGILALTLILALAAFLFVGRIGQKPAQGQPPQGPVEVKAMQVMQKDTPVTYEFVGQVQAKNEVQIKAKVSGNIVARMIAGGDEVVAGQPLFQIDRRQYEAAALSARAQLAQSEAALANVRLDTERYKQLSAQQAIARQTLDAALSNERQTAAVVEANRAKLQQAENDLDDTLVIAPFTGRVGVNVLDAGSFVQAGQTVLATVSTVDPIFVQFSMSENEYLRLAQSGSGTLPDNWGKNLKLILSNGSEYPATGQIEQVDRGLAQNTGTLTIKAAFPNAQKLLVPGMFARVIAQGEVRKGALLIPQRAVQEVLGKTFVTVVGEGNKAETRPVKMGARSGNLWIVEEGLKPTDVIVVEGITKVRPGTPLKPEMITPEDLNRLQAKQ